MTGITSNLVATPAAGTLLGGNSAPAVILLFAGSGWGSWSGLSLRLTLTLTLTLWWATGLSVSWTTLLATRPRCVAPVAVGLGRLRWCFTGGILGSGGRGLSFSFCSRRAFALDGLAGLSNTLKDLKVLGALGHLSLLLVAGRRNSSSLCCGSSGSGSGSGGRSSSLFLLLFLFLFQLGLLALLGNTFLISLCLLLKFLLSGHLPLLNLTFFGSGIDGTSSTEWAGLGIASSRGGGRRRSAFLDGALLEVELRPHRKGRGSVGSNRGSRLWRRGVRAHSGSPLVVELGSSWLSIHGGTLLEFATRGTRSILRATLTPCGGRRSTELLSLVGPRAAFSSNRRSSGKRWRHRALAFPVSKVPHFTISRLVAAAFATSIRHIIECTRCTTALGRNFGERALAAPVEFTGILSVLGCKK